jgi:hypothetical protein
MASVQLVNTSGAIPTFVDGVCLARHVFFGGWSFTPRMIDVRDRDPLPDITSPQTAYIVFTSRLFHRYQHAIDR